MNINTFLMKSTFMISGNSRAIPGAFSFGTGFLVGKPSPDREGYSFFVLVTAKHVFDEIDGDIASLKLRRYDPAAHRHVEQVIPLAIRSKGQNLYISHPTADISAIYVTVPNALAAEINVVDSQLLFDDRELQQFEVGPGDTLFALGFPHHVDLDTFPVLRSGPIASYPLIPSRERKTFYLNFHVFPGNSGGPVYLFSQNRTYGGVTYVGSVQGVLGLVSQQVNYAADNVKDKDLDVAVIVPSSLIKDTLNLMPPTPADKPKNDPNPFIRLRPVILGTSLSRQK